ncbi:MAG: flagellin [Rhizomicrobium sp.]|jgi:flagellar hook-associated protein 3 FlgL
MSTLGPVSTSAQSLLLISQLNQDSATLNQTQQQVASGLTSTTYGGIGDQTAALESAQAGVDATTAYQAAAQLGLSQVNLQATQLTQLSNLASQLQQDITTAVGNNSGSTLMSDASSIYDQVTQILNSQDSNGNYIFGGDQSNTPPVTTTSLRDLASLPSASQAFTNGTVKGGVQVGDGQTVQVGLLASNLGTGILQTLSDIANFNSGANGNFGTTLTGAQSNFLSTEIPTAQAAYETVNNISAQNGETYQQLQSALTQQQSMNTLYQGFVSNIQNVNMASAISNLNLDQTALQAATEVTAQLGQISLLNYLSPSASG